MSKVLGIDLGTTNSCMSVIDENGRPKIIPNSEGENTTPSVILFRDGERIVGRRAKRSAVAQHKNVAMLMKTTMIAEDSTPFVDAQGNEYSFEELSATVLRKLKLDAERALGYGITQAIITVPAYFQNYERNRTKAAGEVAGFEVLRIINEPTAAALSYGLDQGHKSQTVLVFDLGGGTFDVTIIRVEGNDIRVLSTDGNKSLGGSNFDGELVDFFYEQFKEQTGVDLSEEDNERRILQDFTDRAESAKIDLSADTVVYVALSAAGKTVDIELTREKFESLIASYIEETRETTNSCLQAASLEWTDIDKVLLVGGSTRIPAISKMLEELSNKKAEMGINPDEVVAMGAAIIGATEVGQTVVDKTGGKVAKISITDVTGHSLGIIALDATKGKDCNSIIIPAQTPIPAENTEPFVTVEDNQTSIRITVLQGEDEDPESCRKIGEGFLIKGLPPKPRGQVKIHVTLGYDREGIIHVRAVEPTSGAEVAGELKDPTRVTGAQISDMRDKVSKVDIR